LKKKGEFLDLNSKPSIMNPDVYQSKDGKKELIVYGISKYERQYYTVYLINSAIKEKLDKPVTG